jgi:tRNA-dihydrouridine synthase
VDHIDMNFGCPVPKVTRKGGGSAIPARPALLAAIVRAAVQNAGTVPVTIKFRSGVDDTLLTYRGRRPHRTRRGLRGRGPARAHGRPAV